ncbi:MAG TPA: hypothetical protein VIC28_06140, partial [Thermoanaerobaculia bacterium]
MPRASPLVLSPCMKRNRSSPVGGRRRRSGALNAAVVPWIAAVIRRAERRFPEALKLIDEALALDP